MAEWKLEGSGAQLTMEVVSYERESTVDASDANWLRCRARGTFGAFTCSSDYSIPTLDFRQFETSLREMLEGRSKQAYFSTMEEGLGLDLVLDRAGRCRISGFLRSFGMPRTKLEFTFDSDQSYLQQTLVGLVRVNECFPVRVV